LDLKVTIGILTTKVPHPRKEMRLPRSLSRDWEGVSLLSKYKGLEGDNIRGLYVMK
jgi:hypothetical protein